MGKINDEIMNLFGNEAVVLKPVDYLVGMTDEERLEKLNNDLKKYYGSNAEYRNGQYEAIEGVLRSRKTLVVQKTGWGKSLVYFMATKNIREIDSSRIILIISPLLALMSNQIDSARKLNLNVKTLNSGNMKEWSSIYSDIKENKVDALIVSPERLANEKFQSILDNFLIPRIGLFVVDEAHCISDWGHDFRPDYRRIIKIINKLPENVPVLATTATANDRVIRDIRKQIGEDLLISRGPLMRDSISIQTIKIDSYEKKIGWLVEHINDLPGTGVIYCLTVEGCQSLVKILNKHGINCCEYTGRTDTELKEKNINAFMKNETKALVATTAFGMGYDKPDIGFVIHFQKPKDVISYYQQIGRAGRNIDKAYAICLYSETDDIINKYFIDNAFPTEVEMEDIINAIKKEPGLLASDYQKSINMPLNKIKSVMDYLDIEEAIYKDSNRWYIANENWKPDIEKSNLITKIRYDELRVMNEFVRTDRCFMRFLAEELDDRQTCDCGKCSNCQNKDIINSTIDESLINKIESDVNDLRYKFKVRKQWPSCSCSDSGMLRIEEEYRIVDGYVFCGESESKRGEELLKCIDMDIELDEGIQDEIYDILNQVINKYDIENITYIPSTKGKCLVKNMAKDIATKYNLNFFEAIERMDEIYEQEYLSNGYKLWENVNNNYKINKTKTGNTLLFDLKVRSGWTMTTCGYKLRKEGNGSVYAFAVLSTVGQAELEHDMLR